MPTPRKKLIGPKNPIVKKMKSKFAVLDEVDKFPGISPAEWAEKNPGYSTADNIRHQYYDEPQRAARAIKAEGNWKPSVDLTLVRHGKTIEELRLQNNRKADQLGEIWEDLRSIRGYQRELWEKISTEKVVARINLALIFGLIIAVAYLINR